MNPLKEKTEKKNQEKNKENYNNNNRAREAVEIVNGAIRIAAYSEPWQKGFTTALVNDYLVRTKLTAAQCKAWLEYMTSIGWVFSTGGAITPKNCLRSMRMWRKVDERMAAEAKSGGRASTATKAFQNEYEIMKQREAARRVEMATKAENWELCEERCKNCVVCDAINKFTGEKFVVYSCLKGYKIPPPVRERPVPPEECAGFERKAV